jgi:site-specific DNA-methyltransferase (adenine-specific)
MGRPQNEIFRGKVFEIIKMINMKYRLFNGDCLEEHQHIEDGAVDLILCDLPFGTIQGARENWAPASHKHIPKAHKWDFSIEPSKVYAIANRVLRKNGKMVLFAQEPYTTELINKAIPNIPFSYRAMWLKNDFANGLLANKAMVGFFEDILVFSKQNNKHDFEGLHPLREYFASVLGFIGLNLKKINSSLGHRKAEHAFYVDSSQFSLCTLKTYNELIEHFGIDKMEGFMPYVELKSIDNDYRNDLKNELNSKFPSTFNLWQGGKYKSNVLEYRKDYDGYHPTQKPIALLEDLIQTYSNENDLVFDLTMGSGSTGVAARNTKRRFVGIEKDSKYFEIAQMRINKELKPPKKVHDENGFFQSSIFDFINPEQSA